MNSTECVDRHATALVRETSRVATAGQGILARGSRRNAAGGWLFSLGLIPNFLLLCACLLSAAPATAKADTNFSTIATISTGFGGGEQRAEVSSNILCIAGNSDEVRFYNLTNPASPTLIGSVRVPGTTHAIGHSNEFFYLSGDGWLYTFSCPGATHVVTNNIYTSFPTASRIGNKMHVHDGYLYLATFAGGSAVPGQVCIFTLTNLAAPQLVSAATGPVGSGMGDVAVKGDVLYACGYFDRQIHAFDIADRQNPKLIHTQPAQNHGDYTLFEPWRMLVQGDALYVQDDNSWQIFNISTPTNPVFASDLQVEKDIEGSRLVGNILVWVASGVGGDDAGVLLYDCSDAFHPAYICRTNLGVFSGYYWGDMDADYIYQPQADSLVILGRPLLTPANNAPVARADAAGVLLGQVLTIPTTKLIANDQDVDGDALSIVAVASTSALGAPVILAGGLVTYTAPALGTNDSFTYTLSDGRGGTATGLVQVFLTDSGAPGYNQLTSAALPGGALELKFFGAPQKPYALEWTAQLGPAAQWIPLVTNIVSYNGGLVLTNTPMGGSGFYRTKRIP